MRTITKWLGCASVVALAGALAAPADAQGGHGDRCIRVHAEISARVTAEGCDSPVGFCTRGTLRGFPGGTTAFRALGLGGAPVGESSIVTPGAEPASTWSYRGDLTYTTPVGAIHIEDVGVLDTVRGAFSELQRVVGGTGAFAGATGELFSYGHTTPAGDGFDGPVRGEICVPRRR